MGYDIATITKGGGEDAHRQLIGAIKTLAEANGWVTQRFLNPAGGQWQWIGKSTGLSGTEEIYIGYRTYESVGGDYYNIVGSTFTGYVAGNTFDTQPGAKLTGIFAHNNAITYFMTCNAQRLAMCLKVGTPVYAHGYHGKFFPYAKPGEYPLPYFSGGNMDAADTLRFSDINRHWPYYGQALQSASSYQHGYLRDQSGVYARRYHWPFSNGNAWATNSGNTMLGTGTADANRVMVPANFSAATEGYLPLPVIMTDRSPTVVDKTNVYGELDGIYAITGFNNNTENVMQIGGSSVVDQTGLTVKQAVDAIRGLATPGRAFVVLQNLHRTDFNSFIAMEMK